MERLTIKFNRKVYFGKECPAGKSPVLYCKSCPLDYEQQKQKCPCVKATLLLAAYEDTGLTPAEVAELAKAKADGRLVVLPCKVGETVRVNVGGLDTPGQVMQVRHNQKHLKLIINCNGMRVDRYVDDFGKTVFLTREEAEAALRKEQGDGGCENASM